jgi:NOL1/NOP2/fmu family ribosome biogenesis protein
MKYITLLALIIIKSATANAQNHFVSSGYAGVNTTVPLNDFHVNGVIRWGGYSTDCIYSGQDGNGAYIEQLSSSAARGKLRIQSSRNGDNTNYSQFVIDPQYGFSFTALGNGSTNVGIGTTDTKGYKLAVAGSVIAESLKVKNYASWPDYVFAKDYHLPSIPELEAFIKEHNHLPGIPSEAEVAKEGIDVGEMNKKLLQKVEELTLYIIQQQKAITELQAEMKQVQVVVNK